MYKRLIILSAIILAALCGLVWLGYHSVQIWARGMEGTRLGEFAAVAEQIRQDVNLKLDQFMAREEKRPYTEYQNYYVPDNTVAGQRQMPVVRSPLAGKLGQDLAYGQFQIEPDGNIITPNDGTMALTDADKEGDFYAQIDLNKDNVRYNLLPALTQAKTKSLYTTSLEEASLPLSEQMVEQLTKVKAQNEKAQKQGGKSKAAQDSRGKNFVIESFQNPDLGAQVINRSRAFIRQDEVSNSYLPQLYETDQLADLSMQRQLDEARQVKAKADQEARAAQDYEYVVGSAYREETQKGSATDAKAVSQIAVELEPQQDKKAKKPGSQESKDSAKKDSGISAEIAETEQKRQGYGRSAANESDTSRMEQAPLRPGERTSSGEKAAQSRSQQAKGLQEPSQTQPDTQAKKEAEEQITTQQPSPQAAQSTPSRQVGASYRRRTTTPNQTRQGQARQSVDTFVEDSRTTRSHEQQSLMSQTQVEIAQEDFDMVQVRIEPFVSLMVPCKEGEKSVFGGQVFMLRHIQIENKHFVQGFQLNENELIGEVEESAQRFMREGMNYELDRKANGGSAYTAILDFGFGDMILNLIEIDPTRIARKISGMRTWYFSIITVVLLAVTLGLASLWHNARAQLRLARKKDDFISAVSHELRTPLTSIRMYSEMLEKNWVKSKDKAAEYYKNMRQESERLSRLIENVLDFSRIQRGKKIYDFNLGDMNKPIADVVEMMRPYAAQNGFSIETQLGELGPTTFDGDAVTQIVVNLLDNAIKYARDADDKTVIVRTKGDREFIMIEVEDHGPGVPHRQRRKIFEEFYRIGAESTRETVGTGLGLALVKRFAQAHNGFVEIINARPKGAIFRVALASQI